MSGALRLGFGSSKNVPQGTVLRLSTPCISLSSRFYMLFPSHIFFCFSMFLTVKFGQIVSSFISVYVGGEGSMM